MANRIQLRRDTAANWTAVNPVLTQGEIGLELNTGRIKIGNGTAAWSSLPYFTLSYSDVNGTPTIPTATSDLTNDSGYITLADVPVPFSGDYNDLSNTPIIPADVGDLTDTGGLLGGGGTPTDYTNFNSDLIPDTDNTRSLGTPTRQWKELYVSTGSIYIGNVKLSNTGGTLQINTIEKQIDPDTQEEVEVVLETESIQFTRTSHLELTNDPFITQPAVLGTPVAVTAAPSGNGSQFTILIENTGTTMSYSITQAGTNYVVGQIYKIYYYQIGSGDPTGDITFTISEVDLNGGIVAVDTVLWTGPNTDGTYEFVSIDYQPYVFDTIDTGLTLTRGRNQGLFNIEAETDYDNNTYLSPLGTAWNNDGWGTLLELGLRSYTTFRSALNNQVGNNIIGSELVMRDTINDKYYKFEFSSWGGSNGGYSYTRTEVTDPNYFRKTDGGSEIDIIVADDGDGAGIGITRAGNNSIYNPYRESGYDELVSPAGTLWNIDGWEDLSDIQSRTYLPFYAAYNGGLGNRVPGSKTVMYVPETDKYYAIQWYSWTQGGNGGGFSYTRKELDIAKLNEGIKFADGTVLKTATGLSRVKLTSPGDRRIEEAHGYNEVSVTSRVTNDYTGVSARTTETNYEIFVERTESLDAILQPILNNGGAEISISFDNVTFTPSFLSSIQAEEYWFYYNNNNSYVPQTQGNNVYIKITTGADPVTWWDKADLPGGSSNFRGAVIDYHAYTGEGTIIGTIHIVDDDGEGNITHTEVSSGGTDSANDDLWVVTQEGQIQYRRIDGESKTLKVHWTAKVFYGSELYD